MVKIFATPNVNKYNTTNGISNVFFKTDCCDSISEGYIPTTDVYLHYNDTIYVIQIYNHEINRIFGKIGTEYNDYSKLFSQNNDFQLYRFFLLMLTKFFKVRANTTELLQKLNDQYNNLVTMATTKGFFRDKRFAIDSQDDYVRKWGKGSFLIFYKLLTAYKSVATTNAPGTMENAFAYLKKEIERINNTIGKDILSKLLNSRDTNIEWDTKIPVNDQEKHLSIIRSFLTTAQQGGKNLQYVRLKSNNRRCKVHIVNRKKCITILGKMVALSSIRGQYVKSD